MYTKNFVFQSVTVNNAPLGGWCHELAVSASAACGAMGAASMAETAPILLLPLVASPLT